LTVPLHRVRNYEELEGAQGREVFFRPHRYRAADLLPLRSEVLVSASGSQKSCALIDVSENGAAFEWPKELAVSVGERLETVTVRFDGRESYRGEARVGSVREMNGLTIVGVSFERLLLSIDQVLEVRAIKTFAEERASQKALWRASGHERFKSLVSELRLHLEDWDRQLRPLESELPWHVIHGEDSPGRLELVRTLRSCIGAEVVRAMEEIDRASRSIPEAHTPALREYSRRHLHEFLLQAPAAKRAYLKPLGYPGDYEVMRFLYERPFEGTTLFAKTMSLAMDEMAAGRAVRFRKDLIRDRLRSRLEKRSSTLRVLAIAGGPAQELCELLRSLPELPAPLEVVLFDQDKAALAYAYHRLQPLTEGRRGPAVKITYLHESIKRLLRDRTLFDEFGHFDLIYSAGLFDYLRTATVVQLARDFHARLSPGGELLISNMVPENPSRWYMEHHLDWHLLYRSRAQLLEVGSRACAGARLQILEEESGVNPFLEMSRD
jgi:extracellular factor (EF) 3-hydroxypalmitic acid methyl ester biosynthesis protein